MQLFCALGVLATQPHPLCNATDRDTLHFTLNYSTLKCSAASRRISTLKAPWVVRISCTVVKELPTTNQTDRQTEGTTNKASSRRLKPLRNHGTQEWPVIVIVFYLYKSLQQSLCQSKGIKELNSNFF